MIIHHWGISNIKNNVIHNGVDLTNRVTEFKYAEIAKLRSMYDNFFVCSSNWHPQKRLSSNVELFKYARRNLPGKSCLVIMGNNTGQMIGDHDIFYTGSIDEDVYFEFYSFANWMIHLAWLDHCPNVVCESLSQNTPVICASSGGTREIVNEFGIVLNETQQYNYELTDYDHPPQIDVEQIDLRALISKPSGSHAVIDIISIAKQYIDFLNTVV
jgi:glycosyltransferase involved in cell wall biosynthesis